MDGAIGRPCTTFVDLSQKPFSGEDCLRHILKSVPAGSLLFFSPLAQNLSLAAELSRELIGRGYRTVIGGNMSELAPPEDFSVIHSGIAKPGIYDDLVFGPEAKLFTKIKLGKQIEPH